jgi:hypothetical protein
MKSPQRIECFHLKALHKTRPPVLQDPRGRAQSPATSNLVGRGEVVQAQTGKPPRLLASLGTTEELGGYFKINDWNQIASSHAVM